MQQTQESNQKAKVLFHRQRPDGKTVEFSLEKIDELYNETQGAIPFDTTTNYKDWIKRCVERGDLEQATICLDGIPVGLITYAFQGEVFKELLISTAYIKDTRYDYIPLLTIFAKQIAKENNCKFIRFHTARKGLVKKALAQGFNVSEIVLRLTL